MTNLPPEGFAICTRPQSTKRFLHETWNRKLSRTRLCLEERKSNVYHLDIWSSVYSSALQESTRSGENRYRDLRSYSFLFRKTTTTFNFYFGACVCVYVFIFLESSRAERMHADSRWNQIHIHSAGPPEACMTSFTHSHPSNHWWAGLKLTLTHRRHTYKRHLGLSVLPKDTPAWIRRAGDRTGDPLIEGRRSAHNLMQNILIYIYREVLKLGTSQMMENRFPDARELSYQHQEVYNKHSRPHDRALHRLPAPPPPQPSSVGDTC